MAPVSLKPTQKGVTVMAIVAGAIFVCCLLACLGAVAKVRKVDGERARVEKQLKESQRIAETEQDSLNRYLDTKAQIKYLEASVSTQAYVPTLLKQLEHMGRSVNLKVIGVRPKPNEAKPARQASSGGEGEAASADQEAASKPPPPKPYDEAEIEVTLEGTYMNALEFLSSLTSFPKIIAVNTVQMDPVATPYLVGAPRLTITMSVTAFVFKEPAKRGEKKVESASTGRAGNEAG